MGLYLDGVINQLITGGPHLVYILYYIISIMVLKNGVYSSGMLEKNRGRETLLLLAFMVGDNCSMFQLKAPNPPRLPLALSFDTLYPGPQGYLWLGWWSGGHGAVRKPIVWAPS